MYTKREFSYQNKFAHSVIASALFDKQVSVFNKTMNRTVVLDIDWDDFLDSFLLWHRGTCIQDAFTTLSDDEREFLMTGILDMDEFFNS